MEQVVPTTVTDEQVSSRQHPTTGVSRAWVNGAAFLLMWTERDYEELLMEYREFEQLFHQVHRGGYKPEEMQQFILNMMLLRAIKNQNELIIKIFGDAQPQRDSYAREQAPLDSLLS